jgi:hypothetical protein
MGQIWSFSLLLQSCYTHWMIRKTSYKKILNTVELFNDNLLQPNIKFQF